MQTFSGHQGSVWSYAISPDGAWLLSSSADGTLRQWNLNGTEFLDHYTQWLSYDHKNNFLRFTERAWQNINWSNGVETLPIETGAHEIIPSAVD